MQKSSLADIDCIWFGVDNTGKLLTGANGKYDCDNNRMHLTREMVLDLLPYLIGFVKSGEIKKAIKWEISNKMSKKEFIKMIKAQTNAQ